MGLFIRQLSRHNRTPTQTCSRLGEDRDGATATGHEVTRVPWASPSGSGMGQEVSERSEAGRLLQSHSAFEKGQDERGSSAVRAPPWQSTSRSSLPSATGKFKRNRARAEVRVLTKPQPQRTPSQAAGARRSAGPKGAQSLLPLPLTELSEFLKITPLWCCSPCSSPSPGTPGIRETQPGGARTRPHEALLSQGQGQNSCRTAAWDFNGKN